MSRAYLVRNGPTAGRVEPVAAQSHRSVLGFLPRPQQALAERAEVRDTVVVFIRAFHCIDLFLPKYEFSL